DMYRWSVALQGEEVLSKQAKEKYFTPYVSEGSLGGDTHYGYGWSIGKTREGRTVFEHNGSNGIFFADFRVYSEDQIVLILATNATGLAYMSELSNMARMVIPPAR
ncbi:MAG TPA: serine hydrolase, partial [Thermoanaerobaculia bacterium]|nr:serine hydrolase [Thermoanaerobaculia bacterium]